ncbi:MULTISPECIES: hypothetical protein [Streptomyces]|uniref:Uncharacterized protein n=1 Tax=Streptomyces mirabilis TaxID=68239 RepID=A0ABU3V3Q1_9ACTN|nr:MULTISPECIES: hypothetical protein [Streptomyces]MCX4617367.1 hypothetical protein [Streptomyces mirabilis]MCX5356367.1 hypothetical protein [Streptomyces mirabilis]MDU9000816.1 hypothetical protein [Streptomyces mirabilis]QDN84484.1 hypothetical protein FNV61_00790 [Streptomyces sp. RLB3-6]QDO05344.1 hypothetical protein FNV68_02270 [Streptomyces sp. S1D4-23]
MATLARIPIQIDHARVLRLRARLATDQLNTRARPCSLEGGGVEASAFKTLALSRLAAQHEEIQRLREQAAGVGNIRRLPASRTAPYGSCS